MRPSLHLQEQGRPSDNGFVLLQDRQNKPLEINPLPGAGAPERVVALETLAPNAEWVPTSYLDFRDLRDNCQLVESMAVAKPMALAVGNDDTVERVWGEAVSGNFFDSSDGS